MSRLFLVVLVAGVFALAPAASADVPDCDCTELDDCWISCPGAWGLPGHTPGEETDWQVCVYTDNCAGPLVGFDCLRLKLADVDPDSICVCEEECADFPYVYPEGATDGAGCTTFRFRGTILSLGDDGVGEVAYLQVCGCADMPLMVRSPDVNADCTVGLSDFVVFVSAFGICPPEPSGLQHYTIYTGHCAPCPEPQLSDFVVFVRHMDHECDGGGLPGSCDP